MDQTKTVRIDRATHQTLKRLAQARQTTVANAVARAVRLLQQEQMGAELAHDPDRTESDWLDTDLG